MTLTEFLLARIAEDEEDAPLLSEGRLRMLAECEAKRRIVGMLRDATHRDDIQPLEEALAHLATVYADHPDYNPHWRP